MSRTSGVLAALKAVPGGRGTMAPQSGGYGTINQVAANAQWGTLQPVRLRPVLAAALAGRSATARSGPWRPIQPVPVDEPPNRAAFPDPRLWQYPVGYNLPTQPGTEGFKLASFAQLQTIAEKYSRRPPVHPTPQGGDLRPGMVDRDDHPGSHGLPERPQGHAGLRGTRREGDEVLQAPGPGLLELPVLARARCSRRSSSSTRCSLIFRPKYGKGLGRGLLGSDLDSIRLVSGPTIRPLLDMHGGKPRPPAPGYQQFLFGVPRSDYQTIICGY